MSVHATSEGPPNICDQPPIQLREQDGILHLLLSRSVIELPDLERVKTDLFDALQNSGSTSVLLDLTSLQYMPSTTLGILVAVHNRLLARGGRFHMVSTCPLLADMLQVTKLDRLLFVFRTVEEAVAAFSGTA